MIKKMLLPFIGYVLGGFMIYNGIVVFFRFLYGFDRILTPFEWLFSSIITFVVGAILIIWTLLLRKKKISNSSE